MTTTFLILRDLVHDQCGTCAFCNEEGGQEECRLEHPHRHIKTRQIPDWCRLRREQVLVKAKE